MAGKMEADSRRNSIATVGAGSVAGGSRRPDSSRSAGGGGLEGGAVRNLNGNGNGNGNGPKIPSNGDLTPSTAPGSARAPPPPSTAEVGSRSASQSPGMSAQGAGMGGATFVPLRTAKACDMCKIRKVKCDGDQPCASCKLHQARCVYSKTTRKNLLSQGGAVVVPPGRASFGPGTGESSASGSRAPVAGPGPSSLLSALARRPNTQGYDAEGFSSPGLGAGSGYNPFGYGRELSSGRTREMEWEGEDRQDMSTKQKDRAAYDLNQSRSMWQRDVGEGYGSQRREYPIDPELEGPQMGGEGVHHGTRRPYSGYDHYGRPSDGMYGEPPFKQMRANSPEQGMRDDGRDAGMRSSDNNPFSALTHPGTRPGIPYDTSPSRTLGRPRAGRSQAPHDFVPPRPGSGFLRGGEGRETSNAILSASDSIPGSHEASLVSRGPYLQQYGRGRLAEFASPQSGTGTSQTRTALPDSVPTSESSRNFSPFPMGYSGPREPSIRRKESEGGSALAGPGGSVSDPTGNMDIVARTQDGYSHGQNDYRGSDQSRARAVAMMHQPAAPEPPPPRIIGAEGDLLGNAGITTFQPGKGSGGLCWWGPTSFFCVQDRLAHMLRLKMQTRPETMSNGVFYGGKNDDQGRPELSVWRWGCDTLLFQDTLKKEERTAAEARYDPMFLPSDLAYRFFRSYSVVVHPILPLFNLDTIRASIGQAYSGGASATEPGASPEHQEEVRILTKARDSIVLALGAQIEGGDGDADCPKDISRRWAGVLVTQSRQLMADCATIYHNVNAIKIWLLDATFSSNRGWVEEEFIVIGRAARIAVSLGLHREPTCSLPGAVGEGLREAFWICYVSEKLVSTSHGRPSCMSFTPELDTIPPAPIDDAMKCQVALIGLIGILEQIHSIYTSRDQAVSILSAIDKGLAVDRALNRYRAEIVPEFRNFDHLAEDINTTPTTQEEVGRAYLNFHVCMVYHNVRLLAFLPLLSYAAWKDVQDTGEGPAPDQCLALAEKCVESAKAIILGFEFYAARVPYLVYHGAFAFRFLYAIPVIYIDVLRTTRNSQPRDHVRIVRKARDTLEHLDHPAATVANAMVEDLIANHLHTRHGGDVHHSTNPLNPGPNTNLVTSATPTSSHPPPSNNTYNPPPPGNANIHAHGGRRSAGSVVMGSGLLFGGGVGGGGAGAGGAATGRIAGVGAMQAGGMGMGQ